LTTVGMEQRANDLVKSYSLGMKQRLAVASALLKRPDVLILDEPNNGLDPAGIHEMRGLMRGLAAEGVTVLISSHLLSEIEQVCDSVTIISQGRRVTHGPVAEVLAHNKDRRYRVEVGDIDGALRRLRDTGAQAYVEGSVLMIEGVTDPAWITQTLGEAGIWLSSLSLETPDLETVFLQLTNGLTGEVAR